MSELFDFLKPGLREIRKSINDIEDSYNNDWDILAELCQNSVDAIRKKNPPKGLISLEIDSINRSIIIQDNGIGINPERLPILLAPFSTDKENDETSIGEKGVGLTFVLFSCNDFKITSGTDIGSKTALINDAHSWKNSTSNNSLQLTLKDPDTSLDGTRVELKKIKECPIFKLSFEQLQYVLRTKTALGNANHLWDDNELQIEIMLKHKNLNGQENNCVLSNKYWMVYESLDKHSKIDLDDFIEFANDANRTDQDKRRKLKDKVIYKKGEFNHSGRTIKYITCFVPKRKVWDDLSMEFNLCTQENLDDGDWMDELGYAKFSSGIFTSVKGMPTGISIEHPTTGYAGYWSNIFILFEDQHLKFDIGRKSIHGMISRIYKQYSKEIFNEYLKYITKYVSGEVTNNSEWDKEEIFAEIDKLIDLKNSKSEFIKSPRDQEASVSGIFYECIGNGIIKDIKPLVSGYRNKYDLYAKWGNKKLVIEIKARLKNILRDFNDEQKLFDEIDVIVCWNVGEEDEQAMANKGINLEVISKSSLSSTNNKQIPNSTHELILSGFTKPIYVIDMKMILDE
ncbi:ATP-binding protein [Lacinutrix sp. 5H-3-7-4]|uniref:ATP-binding protein n=1 Tax=Lacinutrix sp. (strain 5H-3-7-4) TaxID=983544 RepID=UPI00020A33D8|nr:ATP-binding protein [Lacinutrix sp. 5H-3-7-4]AEH01414.1 ATP-binding region ATPase domain protein [Lacinutrix sp. 5H-3-7-4]